MTLILARMMAPRIDVATCRHTTQADVTQLSGMLHKPATELSTGSVTQILLCCCMLLLLEQVPLTALLLGLTSHLLCAAASKASRYLSIPDPICKHC